MRTTLPYRAATLLAAALLATAASAEVKRTAYAAVKVDIAEAYKPDAAFEKMLQALRTATRNKDANALFALVAPGFAWTTNGGLAADADLGRAPLHNFKVLFGFREFGKDADGAVAGGPFWDALAGFADDDSYYQSGQGAGLICGPIAATVADEDALAAARAKIDTDQESAPWYFVLRQTPVTKAPGDKVAGAAIAAGQAFPVLNTFPAADAQAVPTHYEVLLPSGQSGWIPAAAARPLESNRLCYAQTAKGDWAIALYDDSGQADEN